MAPSTVPAVSGGVSALDAPLLTVVGSKLYRTAYGFSLRVRSDTVRVVSSCCSQQILCSGGGETARYYCANCSAYCFTAEEQLIAAVPLRQSQAYFSSLIGVHTALEPLALELAAYDLATALESAQ